MKTYKKIDLFFNGIYLSSTTRHKTCKDAVKSYLNTLNITLEANLTKDYRAVLENIKNNPQKLKAYFDKTKG